MATKKRKPWTPHQRMDGIEQNFNVLIGRVGDLSNRMNKLEQTCKVIGDGKHGEVFHRLMLLERNTNLLDAESKGWRSDLELVEQTVARVQRWMMVRDAEARGIKEPEPKVTVVDGILRSLHDAPTYQQQHREAATMLAALRHWQRSIPERQRGEWAHFTPKLTPLTDNEIDTLIEKINLA